MRQELSSAQHTTHPAHTVVVELRQVECEALMLRLTVHTPRQPQLRIPQVAATQQGLGGRQLIVPVVAV